MASITSFPCSEHVKSMQRSLQIHAAITSNPSSDLFARAMTSHRTSARTRLLNLTIPTIPASTLRRVLCLTLLSAAATWSVTSLGFRFLGDQGSPSISVGAATRYLYWGPGVDCPGKHCVRCGGLGHQESSLRCALEEAMLLNRTFVLPARMCIANEHENARRRPQHSEVPGSLESRGSSMAELYDLALMSHSVPVILSDSKEWKDAVVQTKEMVSVKGIKLEELQHNLKFQRAHVINRTANKLAWFMECRNRHNRSAITLPYSFLPSMAAPPLRAAAELIKAELKDYDALHVRRGDKVKIHKDKSGALRTMYTRLDRDTQPEAILQRIEPWISEGRTLYVASDENQVHYFDKLSSKFKVVTSEKFAAMLDPVVHNNYELFMVERLVLLGAKTLVKTWKEEAGDLSLSDEAKKKLRRHYVPLPT